MEVQTDIKCHVMKSCEILFSLNMVSPSVGKIFNLWYITFRVCLLYGTLSKEHVVDEMGVVSGLSEIVWGKSAKLRTRKIAILC